MNWRFRTSFFGKLILQVERAPKEWEDATTVDLKHYYEDQARLSGYLRQLPIRELVQDHPLAVQGL